MKYEEQIKNIMQTVEEMCEKQRAIKNYLVSEHVSRKKATNLDLVLAITSKIYVGEYQYEANNKLIFNEILRMEGIGVTSDNSLLLIWEFSSYLVNMKESKYLDITLMQLAAKWFLDSFKTIKDFEEAYTVWVLTGEV